MDSFPKAITLNSESSTIAICSLSISCHKVQVTWLSGFLLFKGPSPVSSRLGDSKKSTCFHDSHLSVCHNMSFCSSVSHSCVHFSWGPLPLDSGTDGTVQGGLSLNLNYICKGPVISGLWTRVLRIWSLNCPSEGHSLTHDAVCVTERICLFKHVSWSLLILLLFLWKEMWIIPTENYGKHQV